MHIHGMEFFVMSTGHGNYPDHFHPAFTCVDGKVPRWRIVFLKTKSYEQLSFNFGPSL